MNSLDTTRGGVRKEVVCHESSLLDSGAGGDLAHRDADHDRDVAGVIKRRDETNQLGSTKDPSSVHR